MSIHLATNLIAFLLLAAETQASPSVKFKFKPTSAEISVFTYQKLASQLPNFPNKSYMDGNPWESFDITIYKSKDILPGEMAYILLYDQPKINKYDFGTTFCVGRVVGNEFNVYFKSGTFLSEIVNDICLIDFDNDKHIDLFITTGIDYCCVPKSRYLYKNINGSFAVDVIYFTSFIDSKEFSGEDEWREFNLVDLNKDKVLELIIENASYSRVYKWNGEVYVLQSKKPVTKIKK